MTWQNYARRSLVEKHNRNLNVASVASIVDKKKSLAQEVRQKSDISEHRTKC